VRPFLDTNLLVYAQTSDPRSVAARQAILAGGVISVQVLNEFAAVLRRKFKRDWDEIAEAVADVRTTLDPVRPISIDTHAAAVDLAKRHGFSFYDALIVASALEARCDTLLTEDLQTGRSIQGLTIVNPLPSPGDG
jgi:predicted nucleic acid-binding protein